MKDSSLFDLLLDLFERTITQLKERYPQVKELPETVDASEGVPKNAELFVIPGKKSAIHMALMQSASDKSFRVFTTDERVRLTKVSYQFLQRLLSWGVVSSDMMELILNRLMFSDSHLISLSEVKWTVRNTLAATLDDEQLAFLDLVLYDKEHGVTMN
jgi:uncharacterized protein Smg (DUF494 family)